MYSYYAATAVGWFFPWPQVLTVLQILQMVVGAVAAYQAGYCPEVTRVARGRGEGWLTRERSTRSCGGPASSCTSGACALAPSPHPVTDAAQLLLAVRAVLPGQVHRQAGRALHHPPDAGAAHPEGVTLNAACVS